MTAVRGLLSAAGPFASMYLDASHDTEDAPHEVELRWRGMRDELAAQGAGDATVAALDDAMRAAPAAVGRAGRALVAAGDRVLIDVPLPAPPDPAVLRYSPLPYLMPLVEHAEPAIPHVVAVVDRAGADLRAYHGTGDLAASPTVQGERHPLHRTSVGGWNQRQVQRRVDETVRENATEVAGEIGDLAGKVGAELVVLAGEVQGRSAVHRALPEACRQIAVEVESGGRAPGADGEAVEREARRLVAERARARDRGTVERFNAELGSGRGQAVHGLVPVTAALREGKVATLLVTDAAIGERTVRAGAEAAQLAVDAEQLRAQGVPEPAERRADEALPLAAAAVGAEVLIVRDGVPDPLQDGMGALLRYP
ncbi:Rv2629 family ribosome hibernation factor [Gandjariella thermophila]|nr:Vms1/Ankzf1 family peptidyl-tRNA hydrolase [Gandjariella thermophila]